MNRHAIEERVIKARSYLVRNHPFFGCLALSLELVCADDVPELSVDTMAVDGERLYWCPAFVAGLSESELHFVFAHEVMHCAKQHMTRRGNREPGEWNVAGDYNINGELISAKVGRMPSCGLYDPAFDGMSAEQIYAERARKREKQKQQQDGQPENAGQAGQAGQGAAKAADAQAKAGQGGDTGQGKKPSQQPAQGQQAASAGQGNGQPGKASDPGRCGGVLDAAPRSNPAKAERLADDWTARVRQAVAVARSANAGETPCYLKRLVQELDAPRVDWRDVLRNFLDGASRRRSTWSRPDRRHVAAGLYLPGTERTGMRHMVVAVDTSGSIGTAEIGYFATELRDAFEAGGADKLSVVFCDSRIKGTAEYLPGDDVSLDGAPGGGGTRLDLPFDWLAENAPDASAMIYFTDLQSAYWPKEEPACPVLWASYGNLRTVETWAARIPFGERIHIERE